MILNQNGQILGWGLIAVLWKLFVSCILLCNFSYLLQLHWSDLREI